MKNTTTEFLDRKAAAQHCGIPESYLANFAKSRGGGPPFVKVSPRKTLYVRDDLDKWISTWTRIEPKSA